MVARVAERLGDLRKEVVFLGGGVTDLLITDPGASEIRPTDDVDVIAGITSHAAYGKLSERLRKLQFRKDTEEGAPACRWVIDGIKVDVMPTSAKVLGFSNQWYGPAIEHAQRVKVGGLTILVVTAPYFLATKLEAFDGRGGGDYRASHDLEDLVAILDGRPELVEEVAAAPRALRNYLGQRFKQLMDEPRFLEALPGHLPGDAASQGRVPLLLKRVQALATEATKKTVERIFLDRLINDLKWSVVAVRDGDEPPDFFVDMAEGTLAIEVTRIFRREGRSGSPEAEQEHHASKFVARVASLYFSDKGAQSIQVSVALPPVIHGPAVRTYSRYERGADENAVLLRAVSRLRHIPKLAPWERHKFQVRQMDGRPLTFYVTALPLGTGLERKWDAMNNTVGWVANVDDLLQRKINNKVPGLKKYRDRVASSHLLIVADGSAASGFLEVSGAAAIDPKEFDAVYFQGPTGGTVLLPAKATDPIEEPGRR